MTQVQKSPADLFLELAKPMHEAGRELYLASDEETRPEERTKHRKAVAKLGFDYALAAATEAGSEDELAALRALGRFNEEDTAENGQYNAAVTSVNQFVSERSGQTSNFLSSNLEGILGSADGKKLEKLLGDEEFTKFTPKEYLPWVAHYAAVAKYKEVAEKAKKGKLEKEDLEIVIEPLAKAAAEKRRKAIKEKGLSADVQQTGADLARFITHLGYTGGKEAIIAATERAVKEKEDKFRDYQKGSEQDINKYVASIIGEMSKDPKLFREARDKLYGALTAKN